MRLSRSGILSVLLHAAALYGLAGAAWHTPRPTAGPRATIVWLAAPQAPPTPAASENQTAASEPTARSAEDASKAARAAVRPRPSAPRASRPPRAETKTAPPAAESTVAPAPDLLEARRRAAVEALEDAARGDSHRSFAFPGTIAEQRAFDDAQRLRARERGLQPPQSVFDSPAKGRAGLPEEPSGPFGVHWVSDDCYVFREPLERFVLRDVFIEPTTCTRRHPRTDLFLTAKPSYLMKDEERAAVDTETQRRERLRRPTTGAVMPLAKD